MTAERYRLLGAAIIAIATALTILSALLTGTDPRPSTPTPTATTEGTR